MDSLFNYCLWKIYHILQIASSTAKIFPSRAYFLCNYKISVCTRITKILRMFIVCFFLAIANKVGTPRIQIFYIIIILNIICIVSNAITCPMSTNWLINNLVHQWCFVHETFVHDYTLIINSNIKSYMIFKSCFNKTKLFVCYQASHRIWIFVLINNCIWGKELWYG